MPVESDFAFAADIERKLRSILFPTKRPRAPERGVIGIVYRSTGSRRSTLLLSELIYAEPGDVDWKSDVGLLFSKNYKSRAVSIASTRKRAGLIFIHTHRARLDGLPPEPSDEDYAADQRDLYFLGQDLSDGAPLVAGIVDDNFNWTVREYEFTCPMTVADARSRGPKYRLKNMRFCEGIRIWSNQLTLKDTNRSRRDRHRISQSTIHMTDSSIHMWGEEGQELLRRIRLGIVGLGGVGSILAEHAARLGVRDLVLVDFDRLSKDNFNRSQGATRLDFLLRRHKVKVAARLARKSAVNKDIQIIEIIGSVVEKDTIRHLLDCDLILNASDSPWGLQVLDQLAHAHIVPVITGGTIIKGKKQTGTLMSGKCEVTLSNPGVLCLECAGSYNRSGVTEAMEAPNVRGPRRYLDVPDDPGAVDTELERAPSVIATNGLVASLMLLRLQALIVGTTTDAINGIQRYHLLEGSLYWAVKTQCDVTCARKETVGLGDAYALPTGIDQDYKYARKAEPKNIVMRCFQFLGDFVAELRA